MSEFIKKAQEALERAEKDLKKQREAIPPDYFKVAEAEIQISASWITLHNFVAMDS